jgi:hypothetical protein
MGNVIEQNGRTIGKARNQIELATHCLNIAAQCGKQQVAAALNA